MKTSEDMARSVLNRAQAHRATVRKRIFTAVTATMCLSIAAVAVFSLSGKPNTPTGSPTGTPIGPQPVRLALFKQSPTGDSLVYLEKDVRTPANTQIRLHDVRELSKEERETLAQREQEYADALMTQYTPENEDACWYVSPGRNSVLTMISAGCLTVPIEDSSLVENVRVSVTGDGQMWGIAPVVDPDTNKSIPGESISEGFNLYHETLLCGGVRMIWTLSLDAQAKLMMDPTIPLSSIESTITTVINMKDGSKLVSVVDVTVDDSGEVYFTSRSEAAG